MFLQSIQNVLFSRSFLSVWNMPVHFWLSFAAIICIPEHAACWKRCPELAQHAPFAYSAPARPAFHTCQVSWKLLNLHWTIVTQKFIFVSNLCKEYLGLNPCIPGRRFEVLLRTCACCILGTKPWTPWACAIRMFSSFTACKKKSVPIVSCALHFIRVHQETFLSFSHFPATYPFSLAEMQLCTCAFCISATKPCTSWACLICILSSGTFCATHLQMWTM